MLALAAMNCFTACTSGLPAITFSCTVSSWSAIVWIATALLCVCTGAGAPRARIMSTASLSSSTGDLEPAEPAHHTL